MVKGCSNSAMQCILFTFNFIFVCLGAAICGGGIYFLTRGASWDQMVKSPDQTASVMIVSGALVFLISFFGCCGALKESSCLLRLYCIIVGALALLTLAPMIMMVQYRKEVEDFNTERMERFFNEYSSENPNKPVTSMIDRFQWENQCCGLNGPDWWSKTIPSEFRGDVPLSCCQEPEINRQGKCRMDQVKFNEGCDQSIKDMINLFNVVALVALCIVCVTLLLAACFACALANAIAV
ncbi:23 kDa integral membrane protein-like [Brevipalpus obovatus]|uniref:23 kDa integral membrane protein-like n=1 Tax=Brevipalpus obovatus TaxID=246614 RepID=UPI003D9F13FA